jgi:hypothetical protein
MKAGKRAAVVWLLVVAESKFVCMTTACIIRPRVYACARAAGEMNLVQLVTIGELSPICAWRN